MNDVIYVSSTAFVTTGNWTREQSLLAFRFYCETPFGQLHAKNKRVIELANLIGRTPAAVAMKCVIRLHPGNGLCLSVIHDRAFDQHLFSLSDDHRIILSRQLKTTQDQFLQQVFWPYNDKPIAMPERFAPETAFIERHRKQMAT